MFTRLRCGRACCAPLNTRLSLVGPKTQDDLAAGARGVFVKRVQPTSPAVGLIEAGTQLLSVGGVDLGACIQDVAVRLIKKHTVTTDDDEEIIDFVTSDGNYYNLCPAAARRPTSRRTRHATWRGAGHALNGRLSA